MHKNHHVRGRKLVRIKKGQKLAQGRKLVRQYYKNFIKNGKKMRKLVKVFKKIKLKNNSRKLLNKKL